MFSRSRQLFIISAVCAPVILFHIAAAVCAAQEPPAAPIELPPPKSDGTLSVERALQQRRSVRSFLNEGLTLHEIAQLLWAAQGFTSLAGHRTAPSAGALYPLELYVVAGTVNVDLPAGVYKYKPNGHRLQQIAVTDRRPELSAAALQQNWIKEAPIVLIIAAVYSRTTTKYGARGQRYAQIEVGHAAQNIYLQAESLGLGTTFVGAFDDEDVKKTAVLQRNEEPLAILPVGRIRKQAQQ